MNARPFDAQPFGLIAAGLAKAALSRKTRARLERGDSPRSGEPVWRNSYTVGQIEDRIWKPINGGKLRAGKRWTGALLKAAKALELRTRAERRAKEPGARNGALGVVGIAVLEYLYDTVDYASGRLDPALRTIADATGHAYSAVHDALVRLRNHGFLTWARRSNATPLDERFEHIDAFFKRWQTRPTFLAAYADRNSGVPELDNRPEPVASKIAA